MNSESNRNIQKIGLPDFDEVDAVELQNCLEKTFDKLQQISGEDIQLVLHFKDYNKGGSKTKHSVHARLIAGGKTTSAQEVGWKAVATAKKALSVLEREAVEAVKREEMKKKGKF